MNKNVEILFLVAKETLERVVHGHSVSDSVSKTFQFRPCDVITASLRTAIYLKFSKDKTSKNQSFATIGDSGLVFLLIHSLILLCFVRKNFLNPKNAVFRVIRITPMISGKSWSNILYFDKFKQNTPLHSVLSTESNRTTKIKILFLLLNGLFKVEVMIILVFCFRIILIRNNNISLSQ